MKRTVKVYRAETGDKRTAPAERQPFHTFEIEESRVDKARELARSQAEKTLGESVTSALVLADGGISITLRARA